MVSLIRTRKNELYEMLSRSCLVPILVLEFIGSLEFLAETLPNLQNPDFIKTAFMYIAKTYIKVTEAWLSP